MFLLCHALFVARSHMNNLCIAFQYLNLSGSGSALLKCKSEKNFDAGSRSAVSYLRFVTIPTIGVGVLFSSRCPILPFFAQRTQNFDFWWTFTGWQCTKIHEYQVVYGFNKERLVHSPGGRSYSSYDECVISITQSHSSDIFFWKSV